MDVLRKWFTIKMQPKFADSFCDPCCKPRATRLPSFVELVYTGITSYLMSLMNVDYTSKRFRLRIHSTLLVDDCACIYPRAVRVINDHELRYVHVHVHTEVDDYIKGLNPLLYTFSTTTLTLDRSNYKCKPNYLVEVPW